MKQQHKEALESCLVHICENLDVTEVLVFLRSKRILNDIQCQKINTKNYTPYQQSYALVDILIKSSDQAFDHFIESLNRSNQVQLANIIIANVQTFDEQQKLMQLSLPADEDHFQPTVISREQQKMTQPLASGLHATITKQIFGFPGVNRCCLLPDGQSALILTDQGFMQVSFGNGERTALESEYTAPLRTSCAFIHTVLRTTKVFVLSAMIDSDTSHCILICQSLGAEKASLIDEHNLGVDADMFTSWVNIQENESGNIYFIVHMNEIRNQSRSETFFHVVKIAVDEYGKIQSDILAQYGVVEGAWYGPFLHLDNLYWLPMNELYADQMLQVSFNMSDNGTVDIVLKYIPVNDSQSYANGGILQSGCQNPVVIGDNIFYYSYTYENDNGQLLHLDLISKCWQTLSLDMRSGAIFSQGAGLNAAPKDGYVYLNGFTKDHVNREGWIYCVKIDGLSATLNKDKKWTPSETYEKQEKLGSGAFGVVYKCWDSVSQQYFVAKYTHIETDQNIEIARNEVKHLQNCSHTKVVGYFGFKVENNNIIIFMEYMPGGSLFHFIEKNGPITEENAVNYISQILEGLTYIHGLGIVHSDIKCANLLLDGKGNVKIGDFGIAVQKRLNEINQSYYQSTAKGRGTIHWSAPEVLNQREGCFSRCADLWSLGCTIVEMLTGQAPYSQMPMLQYMSLAYEQKLSFDPNTLTPRASLNMRHYLSQLLQSDVSKRPHTGKDATELFNQTVLSKLKRNY